MKIVRSTLPKMHCEYCGVYHSAGDRFANGERYCPAVKKAITGSDKICKDFALHDFFWCRKSGYWLDVKVCMARQENDGDGCHNCQQGRMIHGYLILTKKGEKDA